MLTQPLPKPCPSLTHRNPTATLITNLWSKQSNPQQSINPCTFSSTSSSSPSQNPPFQLPQSSIAALQISEQKITISKQELMQFTKRFALSKIDYEEQVEMLKLQLDDKIKCIGVLEEQNKQLRVQESYMIKVMEELRDRHINEIQSLNNKCESSLKLKQMEIQHLGEELKKIRMWLEQEKMQARRCLGFLKIKDEIIENLDWEVIRLKGELKDIRQSRELQNRQSRESHAAQEHKNYLTATSKTNQNGTTQRVRTNSTKKIILRKDRKQQNKQNKQSKSPITNPTPSPTSIPPQQTSPPPTPQYQDILQLTSIINGLRIQKIEIQNQKFDIISKNRELSNEIDFLKKQIQKLSQQKSEGNKIRKSIDDLNQISKRIKDSQADKQNILMTKCLFLQRHVQKLNRELSRVKNWNLMLQYSKEDVDGSGSGGGGGGFGGIDFSLEVVSEIV